MFQRRHFLWVAANGLLAASCPRRVAAEPRADLYQCDGCEGALDGVPAELGAEGRIGPFDEPGEAFVLTGTVYQTDRTTPASGVLVYAYQTTAKGLYEPTPGQTGIVRQHGRMRGWARTGPDGRYRFNTIKPAPYPVHTQPAHIHLMIGEPSRPIYWIDEVIFEGEYLVTDQYKRSRERRGGSGVVQLRRGAQREWLAIRDIYLEQHPEFQ